MELIRIPHKFNPVSLFFRYTKYDGLTLPFIKVIYVKDTDTLNNRRLIRHELTHLNQIGKDGSFRFSIKYLYYNYKYGYWNNPYEVEARKSEIKEI